MRQKRDELLRECERLTNLATSEGREMTAEERDVVLRNLDAADRLADDMKLASRVASLTAPAPVAPSLLDGGSVKNFRTLRAADGSEVRAFGRGQSMAATHGHTGGLDLEGLGRGLAASIGGQRRGNESELRALGELTNAGGDYLVTEELSSQLIDLARNKSRVFEAGTTVLDMQSSTLRIVSLDEDPTIAFASENEAITEDQPVFGNREIVAGKHGVIVRVSNELLSDGANAGEAIVNSLAAAWAGYLDSLVLTHLFGPAGVGQTDSVGAVDYDKIMAAQWAVRALNGEPTSAIMNSKTLYTLSKLRDQVTGSYLAPPASLSTMQMLSTNAVADTHMIVGDFREAVVGVRQDIVIETSRDFAFDKDQTTIRLVWRGGVNCLRKHFHVLDDLTY